MPQNSTSALEWAIYVNWLSVKTLAHHLLRVGRANLHASLEPIERSRLKVIGALQLPSIALLITVFTFPEEVRNAPNIELF